MSTVGAHKVAREVVRGRWKGGNGGAGQASGGWAPVVEQALLWAARSVVACCESGANVVPIAW